VQDFVESLSEAVDRNDLPRFASLMIEALRFYGWHEASNLVQRLAFSSGVFRRREECPESHL